MRFPVPSFTELKALVYGATLKQAELALAADRLDVQGLAALLSPAADQCLAGMANRSAALTQQRFGRTAVFTAASRRTTPSTAGC
jgi:2-iminoacetate synthase